MFQPAFRKYVALDRETKDFVRTVIAEHRDTFDKDNIRDFIDIYLAAEKSGEETGALTGHWF